MSKKHAFYQSLWADSASDKCPITFTDDSAEWALLPISRFNRVDRLTVIEKNDEYSLILAGRKKVLEEKSAVVLKLKTGKPGKPAQRVLRSYPSVLTSPSRPLKTPPLPIAPKKTREGIAPKAPSATSDRVDRDHPGRPAPDRALLDQIATLESTIEDLRKEHAALRYSVEQIRVIQARDRRRNLEIEEQAGEIEKIKGQIGTLIRAWRISEGLPPDTMEGKENKKWQN